MSKVSISKRFSLLLIVVTLSFAVLSSGVVNTSAQATATQAATQQAVTEVSFYYPVAVAGTPNKTIDSFTADFNAANPDIHVTATYAGGYADIYKAIDTQIKGGGKGPDVGILLSTDMYSLIDNDYVVPLDPFIKGSKDADTYLKDFFPAFLLNSQTGGVTYGVPFQRSTPVLYYNKDMFTAVGIDHAPATTAEMLADAQKLTKSDGSQWGIEIPSDGFPYWLFQGFAIGNGQNLVGDAANKVIFNTPSTVQALQYFVDLQGKYKVMPAGVIKWGDTPTDFTSGKAAMVYHTTGSLTNILKNAKFDVGVGFLPAGSKGYGAPTGGGNLYIMKTASPAVQAAAWRWIQYLTSPQQEADWTVATGYIAPRQSAWDTDTLKTLVAAHPQYAVARDQLQYASKELATHRGADIQAIFGKAVQSALIGDKTPQQALDDAQQAAEKILADYPN